MEKRKSPARVSIPVSEGVLRAFKLYCAAEGMKMKEAGRILIEGTVNAYFKNHPEMKGNITIPKPAKKRSKPQPVREPENKIIETEPGEGNGGPPPEPPAAPPSEQATIYNPPPTPQPDKPEGGLFHRG